MRPTILAAAAFLASLALATPFSARSVHAAPSAADAATARSLFEDARKLMKSGKYAEACPKLEEGARLNPGIGMRFNLALCWEHLGKTASAWNLYLDVAAAAKQANQPQREKEARKAAKALEPLLSQLTIVVEERVSGLEVKHDDTVIGEGAYGTAVYVDPGTHVISATAPEHEPWTTKVDIATKDSTTVKVPKLRAIVKPPPPPPPPPKPAGLGTTRTLALGLGAAGVVGIGLGAFFGARAMSLQSDSKGHCDGNLCDAQGFELRTDALSAARVSTVAFVVGVALASGGAALWLTAPKAEKPREGAALSPWFAQSGGGLVLGGAW